jgi:hypothetical protein
MRYMSMAQESVMVVILGVGPSLVGGLRPQYPAGISCRNGIVRDVLRYHAASANDDVAPNLDAREYDCVGTNPHVVAYSDGIFLIPTIVVVLAVIGTYDANVDTDSYVRAKDDAIRALDVTAGIVTWMHLISNLNSVVMDHYRGEMHRPWHPSIEPQ